MFVQMVRGVVVDAESTYARLDLWLERLAPGVEGWLGTTAGVSEDGELVSFVRFASAAHARLSSDRIEQGLWWAESASVFAGDVTFDNHDDLTVFGEGGSDTAAVVEVLLGRVHRQRGHRDLAERLGRRVLEVEPCIIGGLVGVHDDGRFTQAVYRSPAGSAGSLNPAALLGSPLGVSELRLLRLENLWFGTPGEPQARRSPALA